MEKESIFFLGRRKKYFSFGEEKRRGEIFLAEEKKNEEGKGGEYLGKENTCFAEDRKSGEGKGGKYLEKENRLLGEKEEQKEKKNTRDRSVPDGSDKYSLESRQFYT